MDGWDVRTHPCWRHLGISYSSGRHCLSWELRGAWRRWEREGRSTVLGTWYLQSPACQHHGTQGVPSGTGILLAPGDSGPSRLGPVFPTTASVCTCNRFPSQSPTFNRDSSCFLPASFLPFTSLFLFSLAKPSSRVPSSGSPSSIVTSGPHLVSPRPPPGRRLFFAAPVSPGCNPSAVPPFFAFHDSQKSPPNVQQTTTLFFPFPTSSSCASPSACEHCMHIFVIPNVSPLVAFASASSASSLALAPSSTSSIPGTWSPRGFASAPSRSP